MSYGFIVRVDVNQANDTIKIFGSNEKLRTASKPFSSLQDRRKSTGDPVAIQEVRNGLQLKRFLPDTTKISHFSSLENFRKGEFHSIITYSDWSRKLSSNMSGIRLEKYRRGTQFGRENIAYVSDGHIQPSKVLKPETAGNVATSKSEVNKKKENANKENGRLNNEENHVVLNIEELNVDMLPEPNTSQKLKPKVTPTAQVSPRLKHKTQDDTGAENTAITANKEHNQQQPSATECSGNGGEVQSNTRESTTDQNDDEIKWLQYMEIQFKKIAGEDGEISLDEFKDALKLKRSFFAERFFDLFDKDGSGSIECAELMDGLRTLMKGNPTQKLKFLFDVYDVDGSGSIDRDELKTVLRSCMEESSLSLGEDNLTSLTDILFDAADVDRSGTITFEELEAELNKHPGVIENLTISAAQWLKPSASEKKKKTWTRYFTWTYIQNNLRKVLFNVWFLFMNLGLGGYAAWNYRDANGFIIVARICGMNLNFTCMFILVLMLRKCLTYLRSINFFARILPLDQNILFHKMTGILIAIYSVIHTLAHIGNAVLVSMNSTLSVWEILFTVQAKIGWVGHSAYITGWMLLVILIVMIICSMPFVRRGGHFQVFYITHMLYVPFWILVILHGPNFWKWFVVPGVMFLGEKLFRSKLMKLARYGKTYIEEVNLLPSGVCHLAISRPENFTYKPGDYIFLQIPNIASHEWHPFTISSAPEMQGHIWVHIRSAGHWTNKLYEYFSNLDPKNLGRKSVQLQPRRKTLSPALVKIEGKGSKRIKFPVDKMALEMEKRTAQKHKKVKIRCYVDGPYGTATREIFNTEHAVLVGAGIGVTPMASILQSVMYRYKESKRVCPKCKHEFYGSVPESAMKLKKVDFIWINRDQKSFEWFVSLLTKLESEQIDVSYDPDVEPEKVIEMHMYMTAAQTKTDMKGIGLQVALDLLHKKENKDLITGLKTRTQAGRPNWREVFTKISKGKKGKVKVFFCGAPALGKVIKENAMKYNFAFSKENF